ncbi:hypothetical protein ACWENS_28375 [Streptomyces sp. NPDC004532]
MSAAAGPLAHPSCSYRRTSVWSLRAVESSVAKPARPSIERKARPAALAVASAIARHLAVNKSGDDVEQGELSPDPNFSSSADMRCSMTLFTFSAAAALED